MPNRIFVNVVILPGGRLPTRKTEDDAGWDLYAVEPVVIDPLHRATVRLGICTEFSPGWVGFLKGRSGLARDVGIDVFGGVIDSGYRGEWSAILFNSGSRDFTIAAGDRVCQVVFLPFGNVVRSWGEGEVATVNTWAPVQVLGDSARGDAGFGSSGR